MNHHMLQSEHQRYSGTHGISSASPSGFHPAFLDKQTGEIELARQEDGTPASCHMIDWLPREWASQVSADGRVCNLKGSVIAGFECEGVFYTRAEAAEL